MFQFIKRFFEVDVTEKESTTSTTTAKAGVDQMDEGDYHSGPYGYSPNAPYHETQYGSRFDDEADWAE